MIKRHILLLMLFSALLFTACGVGSIPAPTSGSILPTAIVDALSSGNVTPASTPQPPISTNTSVPESIEPTQIEYGDKCSSELILVTDGSQTVRELWWDENSTKLYFWLNESPEKIWEYRFNDGKIELASGVSRPGNPEVPESLAPVIPEDAIGVMVSPQGNKVVYATKVYTRPTPTPQSIGLTHEGYEFILDIFIASQEKAEPQYIGRIDGGLDYFTWSPDGMYIMVSLSHELPGTVKLWLIDTNTNSIEPFFEGLAELVSISPNNAWVIYYFQGEYIARHLASENELVLPIRLRGFSELWWLPDGDRFLFDHKLEDGLQLESSIYLYDIKSRLMLPVTDIIIRQRWVLSALSPNQTILAYVDADTQGLNVLNLCVP